MNKFTLFDSNTKTAQILVEKILGSIPGITVVSNSAKFTGANAAVSTFESIDFGGSGVNIATPGILLSSGSANPSLSNTSSSFTVVNSTPGDDRLTKIAKNAFAGAGTTKDAAVLEFQFNVTDPSIKSVQLDLIFGSDEFPEYVDTTFVDVAMIFVNGVNYGFFGGDSKKPLSVTGNNAQSGSFINNNNNQVGIEYDGISPRLTVNIPVSGIGKYDVALGVADTGDQAFDSGLFISNFRSSNASAGGLFVTKDAGPVGTVNQAAGPATATFFIDSSSNDIFNGSTAPDIYDLSKGGLDIIQGTPQQLNMDQVLGFKPGDLLNILGANFYKENMKITMGSAILDIDTDKNGIFDTKIILQGDFSGAAFNVVQEGNNTVIKTFNSGVTKEQSVVLPQFSSPAYLGAGIDNDTYIISGPLLTSGSNVTITDAMGSNSIQLASGLEIKSSQVGATALRLTLLNDAVVTILGANDFTYESGGNIAAGIDNNDVSYSQFVQSVLGVSIPASGFINGGVAKIGAPLIGNASGPKATNDDFVLLQFASSSVLGAGAGSDVYLLSDKLLSAGTKITISDVQGANSIQLAAGLSIQSSQVSSTAIRLLMSNGADVTILGADAFTFDPGGNTTAGIDNVDMSYADFCELTLGVKIPISGYSVGGVVLIGVP